MPRVPHKRHSYMHQVYDSGEPPASSLNRLPVVLHSLSPNQVCVLVIMGNHGVMAIGESIARAFDELFYFERACENYIKALMTQKPLRIVSDEIAEKTAMQWEDYMDRIGFCDAHLREIRVILDREEPDYKL